jgi:hypothetical protein
MTVKTGLPYHSGVARDLVDLRSSVVADAGRMTTQLGNPRGRYDEHSRKFSLSKKPRFIDPVEKSQT